MIALLWASPLGKTISVGVLAFLAGGSLGFIKGYGAANSAYWQQQAQAAKQAAKDKEQLALADLERARRAEEERGKLEAQLEALINETETSACKLSARDLQRLRVLAGAAR